MDLVAYVIAQPCIGVKDASCVEVCPVDCIHSDDASDQYFIDPAECIDCGVCRESVSRRSDLLRRRSAGAMETFLALNREYFEKR